MGCLADSKARHCSGPQRIKTEYTADWQGLSSFFSFLFLSPPAGKIYWEMSLKIVGNQDQKCSNFMRWTRDDIEFLTSSWIAAILVGWRVSIRSFGKLTFLYHFPWCHTVLNWWQNILGMQLKYVMHSTYRNFLHANLLLE